MLYLYRSLERPVSLCLSTFPYIGIPSTLSLGGDYLPSASVIPVSENSVIHTTDQLYKEFLLLKKIPHSTKLECSSLHFQYHTDMLYFSHDSSPAVM